jgi:hypothetical protein
MDYFFDQERPDVVAAAAVFIVRVVVFLWYDDYVNNKFEYFIWREDITSKPTFYTNKIIKHLRRRVNLCVDYHFALRRYY